MTILGVIASSTRQGQATDTGAMFPIFATTVGTTSPSTISFTNIPSTYTHLQIRIIARSTYAGATDYMSLTVPSNGTYYHQLFGDGASLGSIGPNYVKLITLMPGATSTASTFGSAIVDILDYRNTNKTKPFKSFNGYDMNGSGRMGLYSGNIDTTSAITSLTFASDNSAGFAQYSQFALYGIK